MIFTKNKKKSTNIIDRFCCKKVLYVIAGLVTIVVVFSTIQTSTIGAKLQYLEEKERKVENDSRLLEEELSEANSLSKISESASNYSFSIPQKIVYSQETEEVGMNLR